MSSFRIPATSAAAVLGLAGGFLVARQTGRRELGGALFAVAGAWCARDWYRTSGPAAAAGLSAVYVAAMGGSHPLAKRIGTWPSVIAVTAGTVAAAEVVTRVAVRLPAMAAQVRPGRCGVLFGR